jgi:hypothetical protein
LNVYAESSAVLAWLLDEERGPAVSSCLASADLTLSSELTLVECDRALVRRAGEGHLAEGARAELSARLAIAATHWMLFAVAEPILTRARGPFPGGPIRTLDAIHLASALEGRSAVAELAVLALDDRVRRVGRALGFEILP